MTPTADRMLLRGRILNFTAEPADASDTGAYDYIEDGGLLMSGGRIEATRAQSGSVRHFLLRPRKGGGPIRKRQKYPREVKNVEVNDACSVTFLAWSMNS